MGVAWPSDAKLRLQSMKKSKPKSPRDRGERRIAKLETKILDAIKKVDQSDPHRSTLESLMGINDRASLLLASDLKARSKLGDTFAKLMLEHRQEFPEMHYYHLTLLDDVGNVSDRHPIVDVKKLLNKADRALRRLGLNGVFVVEAHPLANYPQGGAGRYVLFHSHIFGYSESPLNVSTAEADLINGGAWQNSMGAKPVVIKEVGPASEDLERLARYIVKPPHSAKNRRPRKEDPSRFKLLNTYKGYRPEFALRTMEIFSQIELLDLISSVGSGKQIRQQLRAEMNSWHRQRAATVDTLEGDFDIWQFWYHFRKGFGSKNYLPVRVISGGYRPRKLPKKSKRAWSKAL